MNYPFEVRNIKTGFICFANSLQDAIRAAHKDGREETYITDLTVKGSVTRSLILFKDGKRPYTPYRAI